jgi:hypothetical protein
MQEITILLTPEIMTIARAHLAAHPGTDMHDLAAQAIAYYLGSPIQQDPLQRHRSLAQWLRSAQSSANAKPRLTVVGGRGGDAA